MLFMYADYLAAASAVIIRNARAIRSPALIHTCPSAGLAVSLRAVNCFGSEPYS